jgi:hypothetical protein
MAVLPAPDSHALLAQLKPPPNGEQDTRSKLLDAARILYEKALGDQMPDKIADHLTSGAELVTQLHGKQIVVSKDSWPGHRRGGHSIRFIVRNIPNS